MPISAYEIFNFTPSALGRSARSAVSSPARTHRQATNDENLSPLQYASRSFADISGVTFRTTIFLNGSFITAPTSDSDSSPEYPATVSATSPRFGITERFPERSPCGKMRKNTTVAVKSNAVAEAKYPHAGLVRI